MIQWGFLRLPGVRVGETPETLMHLASASKPSGRPDVRPADHKTCLVTKRARDDTLTRWV